MNLRPEANAASGGTSTDYLNGGADTDTCTRGATTTGCDNESRQP